MKSSVKIMVIALAVSVVIAACHSKTTGNFEDTVKKDSTKVITDTIKNDTAKADTVKKDTVKK